MNGTNLFKIAFRALANNKLRAFLTMLGIIIGVASVIAMLAIGQGSKRSIQKQISEMGSNMIMIHPGAEMRGGVRQDPSSMQTLKLENYETLRDECMYLSAISPDVSSSGQLITGSNNYPSSVSGVSIDYLKIRQLTVEEGEMFSENDIRTAAKVCVIGKTIVDNLFPDGENGFPGNLKVKLTYTVTEANALDIRYEATTDKPTVINLCNHSFFNLSGNLNSSVENQIMWVDAGYFTPYDKKKCVTGELWPVKSTPLDFTQPHAIGRHINDEYGQLQVVNGYDHAWALRSPGDDSRPAAWIYDENSGRKMEIYTTEPAVHIYTGNGLKGKVKGKNDICYPFRGAVCFETCHFQDSPNNPQFPSTTLRPGKVFQSHTVYKFTTD